jgi:hypothetical protein
MKDRTVLRDWCQEASHPASTSVIESENETRCQIEYFLTEEEISLSDGELTAELSRWNGDGVEIDVDNPRLHLSRPDEWRDVPPNEGLVVESPDGAVVFSPVAEEGHNYDG